MRVFVVIRGVEIVRRGADSDEVRAGVAEETRLYIKFLDEGGVPVADLKREDITKVFGLGCVYIYVCSDKMPTAKNDFPPFNRSSLSSSSSPCSFVQFGLIVTLSSPPPTFNFFFWF